MIKQLSWLDTFLVSLFLVSLLALLLALYSRPGDWSDLYGTVRKWEGFHAQAYWDIGGYSQGYGTAGHPGTTIDRATAEQLMEQELARDRAKIEVINPNLSEGSKKALSSLLYNLGGDVGKLHQHGMYEAILCNDVAAMKQAHVQFSHVHGPTGPMVQGLLSRRRDELQYYDQPARLPSGLLTPAARAPPAATPPRCLAPQRTPAVSHAGSSSAFPRDDLW